MAGELWGLPCTTPLGGGIGDLLSIEGRAIRREYQGNGIGTLALYDLLDTHDVESAASVTRNPAIPRLMTNGFYTVSPDLDNPDPLRHFKSNIRVRELTEVYAEHIGSEPAALPFAISRYEGGLYGYTDPGEQMGIPQISDYPENGIIMVATDRRAL